MSGIAALALDRFDHGAFFAANVGARSAAQLCLGMLEEARGLDLGHLRPQDMAYGWIFITHVDKDLLGFHRPGRDEHAFEKLVRFALKIIAVLEGAGSPSSPLTAIRRGPRFRPHQAPLPPGRETGAAEPAQPAIRQRGDHVIARALSGQAGLQDAIATACPVSRVVLVGRQEGMHLPGAGERLQPGAVA